MSLDSTNILASTFDKQINRMGVNATLTYNVCLQHSSTIIKTCYLLSQVKFEAVIRVVKVL